MYNVGELFAGIGGIGLAFERVGFTLSWANELDDKACQTYRKNFDHNLINGDMTKLDPSSFEKVDILTGGFPCQSFSVAGHRKGFEDDRGNLFFDIIRYINVIKPKVILLENVKNLSSHDKGNTFRIIQKELQNAGYYVKSSVLNTHQYSNIPQNRERIYIVCFASKELCDNFKFPPKVYEQKTISTLFEKDVSDYFYYNKSKYYDLFKEKMINSQAIYQWRRVYIRENKSNLCPTLTANMGTGGHNVPLIIDHKGIRKLTPRECARFQGFPDDFILPDDLPYSALYKQIGNSVSVPVIEAIAKGICKALKGEK